MASGFDRNRSLPILLSIGLAASQYLFAGKEFLAAPGEQVMPGQLLVGLQPGADIGPILASLAPQARVSLVSRERNTYLLNIPPAIQAATSKLLAAHPLVNYVEPNRVRHTAILPPNDPLITQQWALTAIHALQAWSYFPDGYLTAATAGAGRVKVAVLDTGADCTHPDFMNAGGSSTDSAQGGQLDWADSLAIAPTTISSPACPWQDDFGHGTVTAGVVGAATNNGAGVASLGFPLQIMVVKTSDSNGDASDAAIAQGIDAAINAGAQVISMSLGGPGYSQTMQTAMDRAWQHNLLVVAAAGNTGDATLTYPAGGNHVLGVGATGDTNTAAGFSTYGNWVKIAAPGVNVISTSPTYANQYDLNYTIQGGTSLSTPYVAALGGLLYLANPGLSVAAIAQRIQQTAQTPNSGWDQYIGYGIIDGAAALRGIPGQATLGSLTGQVVDSSNNPVDGAVVTAGNQSFTTLFDTLTTESTGLFRIANLSPGTYPIAVTAPGFATANIQGTVVAGADTMLTIQMGVPMGKFTGAVTHNGAGVAGAVVEALSGGAIQATAVTDGSGNYSLYVPPATYNLTASAANYIAASFGAHSVSSGGDTVVNMPLTALGTLTGTVVDANGVGVPNAHIDFTSGSFSGGALTGAGGQYSTFGIPDGTYTVTASAYGYSSAGASGVSVTTNTSTLLNFQFSTGVSLTSGLIGHWPLNEGLGSVAHDLSGNGYDAALSNTAWTAGYFNYALSFNGSNSSAVTPPIPFGNAFSVSEWVNPAVAPQVSFAGVAQAATVAGPYLGVDYTGTIYKFVVNGGAGSTGPCAFTYVPQGCAQGGAVTSGWHMVTGTYDGATAILYVDGVMVAGDTFTAPASGSFKLAIGDDWTTSTVWNGALNDLRLYSRALTTAEVSSLFSQGNTVLNSITLSASSASLAYNTAEQFTATGTYSDASTADLTNQVTWASSAPGVATIGATGMAAAVGLGQTNITAALSGVVSNSFQLTVTPGAPAAISVFGGSGQSATVGTAFAGPLQALVKDAGGNATPNVTVMFTAPSNGAGATFSGGAAAYATTTNSAGVATSSALTAGATAGSYSVTAAVSGVAAVASFSLTNLKAPALTVAEAQAAAFTSGENGATYTITVANAAGAGPTSGTVTVTDIVPAGLTLVSMNGGAAWNCTALPVCTTNNVLNGGSAFPAIAVTVNVAGNATAPVINQISVSGGNSPTASVPVTIAIVSRCNVTLDATTSVADVQRMIGEALGILPPNNDLNGDGAVTVGDVQIVLNAALGLGCPAAS